MKQIKYFIFVLLTVVFISTNTMSAYAGIKLTINDQTIDYNADPIILKINDNIIDQSSLPMQPIIINGTTLVPVREVFEALGAVVDYKSDIRQVLIIYDGKLITMSIEDKTYYIIDEQKQFSVPPKIINGKTMIPLRAVSEGIGLDVNWDNATRTVSITEKTINIPITDPIIEPIIEPVVDPIIEQPVIDPIVNPVITPSLPVDVSPYIFGEVPSALADVDSINTNANSITIKFSAPVSSISKTNVGDYRLIYDFNNTRNLVPSPITVPNNSYYLEARTSQFTTAPIPVSRFVFVLNQDVYYSSLLSDDRMTFKIFFGDKNTFFPTNIVTGPTDSVYFDDFSSSIMISKSTGITLSNISINDLDAFEKNIIVNLDSDYSSTLGSIDTTLNNPYIAGYTSSVSNGKTSIAVKLSQWGTLKVTENNTHIIISFADPHTLYDNILVIDAGHGGRDPGSIGNNLTEKNLNLAVALQFGSYIEQGTNIKIYYTRTQDNAIYFSSEKSETLAKLKAVGEFSTAMGDLLFSVHTNSVDKTLANVATGVETLYFPHSNDATIGISTFDCAKIVQANLAADTGLNNRGVKKSELIIFKNSNIPAVLGEMGFISHPEDSKKLATSQYLDTVAKSYAKSTIEIFSRYTPKR